MDQVVIDVGGTEIKGNIYRQGAWVLPENRHYPALAQAAAPVFLQHLKNILQELVMLAHTTKGQVTGVALTFPGPFDYSQGISYLTGLGKFEELYGLNLKQQLTTWLSEWGIVVPVLFENDGSAFAIGAYHSGPPVTKGIYLTLGTGLGSSFVQDGQLVKQIPGANQEGMIYQVPFRNETLDSWLSATGLMKLVTAHQLPYQSGKELAEAATAGDAKALLVFREFGELLGAGLQPFVAAFQPNVLCFGGQVSRSFAYFEAGIRHQLASFSDLNLCQAQGLSQVTLLGLHYLLEEVK